MPAQSPLELDLSALLLSARDQGSRGTCVAFAITALHEARHAATHGTLLSLSEETLYWGAKQADRNYSPGTSFRSANLALGKWGQPKQDVWPYDPLRNDRDVSYVPPAGVSDPSCCHRARLSSVAVTVKDIKAVLDNGQSVALSVQMSTGFFMAPDGHIPLPQPHERLSENHAVLVTGYGDRNQVFRFRNSWGTGWGVEGYGLMTYEYLTLYGKVACSLELQP